MAAVKREYVAGDTVSAIEDVSLRTLGADEHECVEAYCADCHALLTVYASVEITFGDAEVDQ